MKPVFEVYSSILWLLGDPMRTLRGVTALHHNAKYMLALAEVSIHGCSV